MLVICVFNIKHTQVKCEFKIEISHVPFIISTDFCNKLMLSQTSTQDHSDKLSNIGKN